MSGVTSCPIVCQWLRSTNFARTKGCLMLAPKWDCPMVAKSYIECTRMISGRWGGEAKCSLTRYRVQFVTPRGPTRCKGSRLCKTRQKPTRGIKWATQTRACAVATRCDATEASPGVLLFWRTSMVWMPSVHSGELIEHKEALGRQVEDVYTRAQFWRCLGGIAGDYHSQRDRA